MFLPPLPLPLPGRLPTTTIIQRPDIPRRAQIIPPPVPELEMFVPAPPDDIRAPVGVVLAVGAPARGARVHVRHVVHDRGRVRGAHGERLQPDGHDAVGVFVVLEEAAEGFEFGRGALDVGPAAVAQGAEDALAAGPGVGGDAAEEGGFDVAGAWAGDGSGVDGEEGVVAAGEDLFDGGGEAGVCVELLDWEKRGGVDVGGFAGRVEAQLAGGVVAEGEDAAFFVQDEGVVFAGCDGSNVEPSESRHFVRLVVRPRRSRCPYEAWDAHLTTGGELFMA